MASDPPPFPVEDNTDEDFFDKLVNDVEYTVASTSESAAPAFIDWNESDEAKAFANLSINELDNNGEVNSDNVSTAINDNVDVLVTENEKVDQIYEAGTVEESGDPLMSLNSSDELDNEHEGAENLSDKTVVSKSSGESLSDTTPESKISSVSGAPVVKEVDWTKFYTDFSQNDSNGFAPYSDFFSELGDYEADDRVVVANDSITGTQHSFESEIHGYAHVEASNSQHASESDMHGSVCVEDSNNHLQYNDRINYPVAADHNAGAQDLNNSKYLENQFPGWSYDVSTGCWYEVHGYDAGANAQQSANSNLPSASGVTFGQTEVFYLQQAPQSVAATVAEVGSPQGVMNLNAVNEGNQYPQLRGDTTLVSTNWNNSVYPPHIVFDPQYPDWCYDTIAEKWIDRSNMQAQFAGQVQCQTQHNIYTSADTFSQKNDQQAYSISHNGYRYISQDVSIQNQNEQCVGRTNDYIQQSSSTFQCGTFPGSQVTNSNSRNQITEKQHAHDFTHGNLQDVNFEPSGSYCKNANQFRNNYSRPSGSQSIDVVGNLGQQFNVQNNPKNVSADYTSNQNSLSFPQHQTQNTQISCSPAVGRSSSGRPAHALVAFGFGGKLIVMKDNGSAENSNYGNPNPAGGSISVLHLAEVVNEDVDAVNNRMGVRNYFQVLCRQSVPGPLTGGSIGTKELNKWIDERIENSGSAGMDYGKAEALRLLLSLLKLACQYYGKLRSTYGTDDLSKENDAPELAVARLFAAARRIGMQFNQYGTVAQCLQQMPSEGQMKATAAEVQSLLASGRRKEALECAQEGQLWGPALVLATQLGDQFYVETVKQMALHHLVAGSPLRTLCLLIAGQPRDVFSADYPAVSSMAGVGNLSQKALQVDGNGMLDDWEENLAVIVANRTKDDELVLIHLGDCLWKDRSDIIAAHICYLVAEANFEPYSDSARMCLVGADHWKFPRTYASPEAIQRTEIYEYAKALGNSQFVLLPFQPYKLVYANMLAEVGRMSDALKYCKAVLRSLKTGRASEVENLRHLVSSLEERIKAHQQGGFSTNLAPKKLVGKLLNLFDSTAHRVVGGFPPPVPTSAGMIQSIRNQSMAPRVQTSQSTMAMSSLVPSQSMEPISEWAADSSRVAKHTRSVSEPDFGRSPRQGQADSLYQASSAGSQDKGSAGGVTSRFSRFGFGSQLLQKTVGLVFKPRQGQQAKLGETNKFYYDEKLKRWVEEGAEPLAEESALPPPPTTVFQNGTSDYVVKSALQSEASHSSGTPEYKIPGTVDNNSVMPPLPPSSNQYLARGRMGVRSRYVDTFNQGSAHATNSFKSPSVPSLKLSTVANPKFFVPTPISSVEQPVDGPVNSMQDTITPTYENNSSSPNKFFRSPAHSSSMTMQRFASMNSFSGNGSNDNSFSVHSWRTASWSGSFDGSFSPPDRAQVKLLGEVLGMHPSSFMPNDNSVMQSSVNGGSFGDDLHEVEL